MVSYLGFLQDQYVLGDSFVRNFYTTFDLQKMQIGLAQNANGPVTYQPLLAWYWILMICIAALVILVAILLLVCYVRGRGKNHKSKTSDGLIGEDGNEVGENELPSDALDDNPLLGLQARQTQQDDEGLNSNHSSAVERPIGAVNNTLTPSLSSS